MTLVPQEFSSKSLEVLHAYGWSGKKVDITPWVGEAESIGIRVHAAARDFLTEFDGLAIEGFEIDPLLCRGEEDRFLEWSNEIGKSIFRWASWSEGDSFWG
jgi:SUKH-3 immunity protein of toxin-antitoxin system